MIDKHAPRQPGVYGFWYGKYCVYVGKTEAQTLFKRLIDHWEGSHNPSLKEWIQAKRDDLQIAFIQINDKNQIATYERYYIRTFQPLTNKIRYL
jgi:excinuclease UvrABC nuclease subunit